MTILQICRKNIYILGPLTPFNNKINMPVRTSELAEIIASFTVVSLQMVEAYETVIKITDCKCGK
jgi:hypothetical protein